jgi:hypothetical protein
MFRFTQRMIPILPILSLLAGFASASEQHGVISNGHLGITITNMGRIGNAFSNRNEASCEYPLHSRTEHLYLAGLWVGARTASGDLRVSTSVLDVAGLYELENVREFHDFSEPWGAPSYRYMSSDPLDDDYDPQAIAPAQVECLFDDYAISPGHVPLGLMVKLRALAWDDPNCDDFVVLEYTVTNISPDNLRDVYVGFFNDTTVSNTDYASPYDPQAIHRWDYWDDLNGAWRPGDVVSDPGLWMMHEHDDDGDDGYATSWVGCRLLGTEPQVAPFLGRPPVSYNCWRFRGVPQHDDWYADPDEPTTMVPGRYQLMSNGDFDVGVTPGEDFTTPSNRPALLSTGPFLNLAPSQSVKVTFALTLGADDVSLRYNSRMAKLLYDYGFGLPIAGTGSVPGGGSILSPPVPNPFNPSTALSFELPESGQVRIRVYDAAGRLVARLIDELRVAGRHEVRWDGRDSSGREVGSGSYLARLEFGGKVETVRMGLVR